MRPDFICSSFHNSDIHTEKDRQGEIYTERKRETDRDRGRDRERRTDRNR